MKKVLILFLVIISCFSLCGCTSFDKEDVTNKFNDYFDWFEDEFGNSNEEKTDSSEEASIEITSG